MMIKPVHNFLLHSFHLAFSPISLNTAGILSKTPRVTSLLRLNNRFGQSSGCVVCNCDEGNDLAKFSSLFPDSPYIGQFHLEDR